MQNLKCDMQCVKNSNRELITVCAAYLHPSSPPLLHGNEAMNGSMSTGRGSRRGMQLWTPTRETRRHVSFPSLRLPPEGLVLKWHRGGCREAWLVENKKILTVVAERNETGQGHVTWESGGCVLSCVRLLCEWILCFHNAFLHHFLTYARVKEFWRNQYCLIGQCDLIYLPLYLITMIDAERMPIKCTPPLRGGKLHFFAIIYKWLSP